MSAKLSTSLETATNKLMSLVEDLNNSLGHVTKTLIPQLNKKVLELASSFDAWFKALAPPSNLGALECGPTAPNHVDDADGSSGVDDADGSRGSAPVRTQVRPSPAAPPLVDVLGNDNSDTELHAHDRIAPNALPDHATSAGSIAPLTPPTTAGTQVSPNGTYTLPTGHFWIGIQQPYHGLSRPNPWQQCGSNGMVGHAPIPFGPPPGPGTTFGHTWRASYVILPPTPPCLPQQHDNHNASCRPHDWDNQHHPHANSSVWHLALLGGPIISPRASNWENKACKLGKCRLNILRLATGEYHIDSDCVDTLTAGILVNCGYNRIMSDDIVTCYNDIIATHCHILNLWHNPTAHTFGRQVDQILLKSFNLFPTLESMGTDNVVNFYDRFQELSMSHFLALMPFDAIS
jgi:hypothetical protein